MKRLKFKQLNFKKAILITVFIALFFLLGGPFYKYFLSASYDIYQTLWKIVWTILAFGFIKYYNDQLLTPISEMFSFKKINFRIIFIILSVISLLELIASFVRYGRIYIPSDFNFFKSTLIFFFVGLAEEMVFRGWAMNAFSKFTEIKKANILQSVFFMLIHLLPWCVMLVMGGSVSNVPVFYLAMQLPFALVMGYVFGIIFSKTKSIWTVIIAHCFVDVLAEMFGMM